MFWPRNAPQYMQQRGIHMFALELMCDLFVEHVLLY